MSKVTSPHPCVILDELGVAWIAGSTMKVVELVMAQRAHGWSPEEIAFQFPHLDMVQVHGALAYHRDHQSELDEEIVRRTDKADELRRALEEPPFVTRLRRRRSRQ